MSDVPVLPPVPPPCCHTHCAPLQALEAELALLRKLFVVLHEMLGRMPDRLDVLAALLAKLTPPPPHDPAP